MRQATVIAALSLCAAAWSQIDKPSPIPSRNKKPQTQQQQPAPAGESDRSSKPPAGATTGSACFFKPKDGTTLRAAHPDLPTGTKVKVTNLGNKKEVVVTITDHGDLGPHIISLSRDAAEQLDFLRAGTAQVKIEPLR